MFVLKNIFKKILTATNIYIQLVLWQQGEKSVTDRCGFSGSAPHFLDNLACLFLGGAHFKHVVSTVKEPGHSMNITPELKHLNVRHLHLINN